jgi:Lar family restriction alleviation protein
VNKFDPCPFCGELSAAVDSLNYTSGKPAKFRIQCQTCGVFTKWYDTADEAWESWNTRAKQAKPRQPSHFLRNIFICKDLFVYQDAMYARNPKTDLCYRGDDAGGTFRRIKKADYLMAYAECVKAVGK